MAAAPDDLLEPPPAAPSGHAAAGLEGAPAGAPAAAPPPGAAAGAGARAAEAADEEEAAAVGAGAHMAAAADEEEAAHRAALQAALAEMMEAEDKEGDEGGGEVHGAAGEGAHCSVGVDGGTPAEACGEGGAAPNAVLAEVQEV